MGISISTPTNSPPQVLSSPSAISETDLASIMVSTHQARRARSLSLNPNSTIPPSPQRPSKRVQWLDLLPPEIWTLILTFTREFDDQAHGTTREPGRRRLDGPTSKTLNTVGNQTTIALASTCRFLRSIADPFLWDRLSFYLPCLPEPNDPTAEPRPENITIVQERGKDFLTFLKRNPEIRDGVKEFSVYVGNDAPQDDGSLPLVALFNSFTRLLPMLPKLDSISISGASIPLDFLLALFHLIPNLHHLSIVNCRWPRFPPTLNSSALHLRTLRIKGGKWIQQWLDQFLAHTDVLEDVELDDSFPGTSIKHFPQLKRLSVKEVNHRDINKFCRTMSNCPNLEDITIAEAMMDPTFNGTCLPRLRAMRGNILNCVFIEGRPVESVDLTYPGYTPWGRDLELNIVLRRVLEVCASGTAPIKMWKIVTGTCGDRYRWNDVEIAALVETFPHLELLDVDINPDSVSVFSFPPH